MAPNPYPPTDGSVLRQAREDAGLTQDEVAQAFSPPTTRQRLRRTFERAGVSVSYVDAAAYRAALDAAVAAKVGIG